MKRRQAFLINPGQAIRVQLAIEWRVHPSRISARRVNSAWRDRATNDPAWIARQRSLHFGRGTEEVVIWQSR